MNTTKKDVLISAIALAIVSFSSFSISHIVASKGASFGLTSIILPALASFGGVVTSAIAALFALLKAYSGYSLVAKGIPTLASLATAHAHQPTRNTVLLNIGLPIVMSIIFIAHPVGSSAWVYTLFWIIPVICEISRQRGNSSLFIRLLSATFIAHAVGSVIFLYSIPTTPSTWLSLLMIVPAERIIFASGATLTAIIMIKMKHMLNYVCKKNSAQNSL